MQPQSLQKRWFRVCELGFFNLGLKGSRLPVWLDKVSCRKPSIPSHIARKSYALNPALRRKDDLKTEEKAPMATLIQKLETLIITPRDPTYSLHYSSFLGLPFKILNIKLVKPKKGTTMETIGTP